MSRIELLSPAKLNIFLEVIGKRSDGYHELETVMLRTDLSDLMVFEQTSGTQIELRLSDETPPELRSGFPLDSSNLILRAAENLQRRSQVQMGARISVTKVIPPESGLAGGSSNAATTLRGLCRLWNLQPPEDELHEIAATLGSDINFLLSGAKAAICRGRGEIVVPVEVAQEFWFVAVRPKTGNSTPTVFRETNIPSVPESSSGIVRRLTGETDEPLEKFCFNRLTDAACIINGEMSRLMNSMQKCSLKPAFMSGSGSTCFLVADDQHDADRLRSLVECSTGLRCWVLQTST
ncbi:MAG: 4-(cytidine 5'-diphospho)-2-C-methyl-D-erythritol kinase [Planctomyces sp.]|nr:4-(cytidine 5'-diphospho)-2-C-methyl-D-erythritol kinase [Planctomyces sp.]